jgi:hypothetical protein
MRLTVLSRSVPHETDGNPVQNQSSEWLSSNGPGSYNLAMTQRSGQIGAAVRTTIAWTTRAALGCVLGFGLPTIVQTAHAQQMNHASGPSVEDLTPEVMCTRGPETGPGSGLFFDMAFSGGYPGLTYDGVTYPAFLTPFLQEIVPENTDPAERAVAAEILAKLKKLFTSVEFQTAAQNGTPARNKEIQALQQRANACAAVLSNLIPIGGNVAIQAPTLSDGIPFPTAHGMTWLYYLAQDPGEGRTPNPLEDLQDPNIRKQIAEETYEKYIGAGHQGLIELAVKRGFMPSETKPGTSAYYRGIFRAVEYIIRSSDNGQFRVQQ